MSRRHTLAAIASIVLAALTSCGTNSLLSKGPRVLSDDHAGLIAKSGSSAYHRKLASMPFSPATPSGRVKSHVSNKPKDRHGMPVYSTSDRHRFVRTTAYTHGEADHLKYGAMNAAGTPLRFNHRVRSAAADWSVYPVGTVLKIKGLPYMYVVDDYGSALVGTQTVDLFMPNHAWMRAWGMRKVEASVVKWGSFERSLQLLAKRTGHSHCRKMYTTIRSRYPRLAVASR